MTHQFFQQDVNYIAENLPGFCCRQGLLGQPEAIWSAHHPAAQVFANPFGVAVSGPRLVILFAQGFCGRFTQTQLLGDMLDQVGW